MTTVNFGVYNLNESQLYLNKVIINILNKTLKFMCVPVFIFIDAHLWFRYPLFLLRNNQIKRNSYF